MMAADRIWWPATRAERSRPVDATRAALDAIAAHDAGQSTRSSWSTSEAALAPARRRRHGGAQVTRSAPADGVPVSIKDMFLDARLADAARQHADRRSRPVARGRAGVARLRETGAVFLGKTTTPEFAWKGVTDSIRHGVTGNPWDPGLTAGGSSGGSAAAVGLGMGTWSVGTDGGGSVRIPASFTGTVALKPTYGLVADYPPSPFGTLSHAGPMTRTVTDAAVLLDVLVGFDARDWSATADADRRRS